MTRPDAETGIVLFDGVCNLCNGAVKFIVRRDPRGRFRFAPLGTRAAEAALREADHRGELPDSIVLIEDGRVYTLSSAALRIARRLRWPWPLLGVLIIVPKGLRDAAYRRVARNRYRWFGRTDACMTPTPDLRARFLR